MLSGLLLWRPPVIITNVGCRPETKIKENLKIRVLKFSITFNIPYQLNIMVQNRLLRILRWLNRMKKININFLSYYIQCVKKISMETSTLKKLWIFKKQLEIFVKQECQGHPPRPNKLYPTELRANESSATQNQILLNWVLLIKIW